MALAATPYYPASVIARPSIGVTHAEMIHVLPRPTQFTPPPQKLPSPSELLSSHPNSSSVVGGLPSSPYTSHSLVSSRTSCPSPSPVVSNYIMPMEPAPQWSSGARPTMTLLPAATPGEHPRTEVSSGASQQGLGLLCLAAEMSPKKTKGLKKPAKRHTWSRTWTPEEDRILRAKVAEFGARQWTEIAKSIQGRTGKQVRERWMNQLNPNLIKRAWSEEEDRIILEMHAALGNKWSTIAKRLVGRTDNAVKNHYNSTLRSRLKRAASAASKGKRPSRALDGSRLPPICTITKCR